MSRTYRRRGERHEYRRVLRDSFFDPASCRFTDYLIDRHSPEGGRALARFHSEADVTMRGAARAALKHAGIRAGNCTMFL